MSISENGMIKKIGKIAGIFLALFSTNLSLATPNVQIPKTTGPYAVGAASFEWIDQSHPETFSTDRNDKRSLLVLVWYPTDKTGGKSNDTSDIPLAMTQSSFPVLLFSHGFGMMIDQYALQMKELASHGYVVFGIAHPYEAAAVVYPNGRVVTMSPQVVKSLKSKKQKQANQILKQYQSAADPETKNQLLRQYDLLAGEIVQNSLKIWTEDTIFVLNQIEQLNDGKIPGRFTKQLDLEHLGVFGHSFGGAIAGKVCLLDKRVKAGVNLDGHQYGQFTDFQNRFLEQPFMIMYSQSLPGPGVNDFMYRRINNWAYRIVLKNAKHNDFTDLRITNPELGKTKGEWGTIGPERMLKITSSYLVAFFDKHLKSIDSPLLKIANESFPEVDFQVKKGD